METTGATAAAIHPGAANNVDVSVYALASEGANTNILAAGSYLGVVTVTISPIFPPPTVSRKRMQPPGTGIARS